MYCVLLFNKPYLLVILSLYDVHTVFIKKTQLKVIIGSLFYKIFGQDHF